MLKKLFFPSQAHAQGLQVKNNLWCGIAQHELLVITEMKFIPENGGGDYKKNVTFPFTMAYFTAINNYLYLHLACF